MRLTVHTRDRKSYSVKEDYLWSAAGIMAAIKKGRSITCETSGRHSFEVIFNPDNVVSVTES